jgi:hypothetical protein
MSNYNISKGLTIILELHLHGVEGWSRRPSSSKLASFSKAVKYKNTSQFSLLPMFPSPYIVDKSNKVLYLEVFHKGVNENNTYYQHYAIICIVNGFWPCSQNMYQWNFTNWTKLREVHFYVKIFVIIYLPKKKDYQKVINGGPRFLEKVRLFMTPWFLDFDPNVGYVLYSLHK